MDSASMAPFHGGSCQTPGIKSTQVLFFTLNGLSLSDYLGLCCGLFDLDGPGGSGMVILPGG